MSLLVAQVLFRATRLLAEGCDDFGAPQPAGEVSHAVWTAAGEVAAQPGLPELASSLDRLAFQAVTEYLSDSGDDQDAADYLAGPGRTVADVVGLLSVSGGAIVAARPTLSRFLVDLRVRVLVTGSRRWTDRSLVRSTLDRLLSVYADRLVLLHGACRLGVDAFADSWARQHRVRVERYPADWVQDGRRAGVLRNAAMVATLPDLCLAFIRDGSAGASHCAKLADTVAVPTTCYRQGVPA